MKPGQLESFRALMAEMVESTQAEPGALIYEWSISDEASVIHLYERFADSAATLTHLAAFGEKFAQQFLAAVDPTRLVVYGTSSDEVKGGLSAFGPVYTAPFGGFAQ